MRASSLLDGVTAPTVERLLDPGADEADLVVEADAVLLETADAAFDVAADLLLDQAERPLDLLLEAANAGLDVRARSSLDAAEREFDLLLEVLFDEPDPLFDVLADLLLDAAERPLDLFLEPLLDQPDALLDVPADHLLEKPDPLFELFKRLHGHRERDRIMAVS